MDTNGKAPNARKPSPLSLAVATQLRAERAAANMPIHELVRRTQMSRNAVLNVLNGTRVPDITQIGALCDALDVPVIDLILRAQQRLESNGANGTPEKTPPK